MSLFSRVFPWLYEEVADAPLTPAWQQRLSSASPQEKHDIATSKTTPARALTVLARDPSADIRTILTDRLAHLLPSLNAHEQVELYDLTIEAIRALAEDQVTAVRVALSSALKDVTRTPHDIARRLADDAERAVAEPILRYSLALSDQDLLELITRHPNDWHPVTIAQRDRLRAQIGDAILKTGNMPASQALLRNDGAVISPQAIATFGKNPAYEEEFNARDSFARRIKRDWYKMTDQVIYDFLRDKVEFDQITTTDVMNKMHQHLDSQENLKNKSPDQLSEEDIADALKIGENALVMEALAYRAQIPLTKVKRILDADSGKAVIALCVKAKMPMSFATVAQTKLARLSPAKMLYPKNGDQCPLTQDDLQWQWDFFGI